MNQVKSDRAPALLQPGAVTEPLDPARLDARAIQAVQAFLKQGESANTRVSYRSAVRYWLAWFEARYGVIVLFVQIGALCQKRSFKNKHL